MKIALFISNNIGLSLLNHLLNLKYNISLIVVRDNYLKFFLPKNIKKITYNKKNSEELIKILKNIDLGITAGFPILPKNIWSVPKKKIINMHYSLLYSYGGPNPVEWQVHNKEKYTGVSIHFINNNIDKGDLIVQRKTEMPSSTNLVYKKLNPIGNECVVKAIEIIKENPTNVPIIKSEYSESYYGFFNL